MKRLLTVGLIGAIAVGGVASAAAYPTFTTSFCSTPQALSSTPVKWTSASDVTLTGAAPSGSAVSVRHTGGARYDTAADAQGRWTITMVGVPEGQHHVRAYGLQPDGSESGPDVCIFGVDRTPPAAPWMGNAAESWHPAKVDLGGSSEPGSVEVFDGTVKRGTYASNGSWRMQTTFSHGAHPLEIWAIDLAGNRSLTPGRHTIRVDAQPPTVIVETQQARLFTTPVKIEGTAADDRALHAVYLEYRDATGKLLATRQADCVDCWTGSTTARWSDRPPAWFPGLYSVVAVVSDHVANATRSPSVAYISTG